MITLLSLIQSVLDYNTFFDESVRAFDLYQKILLHDSPFYAALFFMSRYKVTVVLPLILPLIVRLPLLVVTVQSPVCADGLLKTELITTWSEVIYELDIVNGRDENEDDVNTRHLRFKILCPLSTACPFASVIRMSSVDGEETSSILSSQSASPSVELCLANTCPVVPPFGSATMSTLPFESDLRC